MRLAWILVVVWAGVCFGQTTQPTFHTLLDDSATPKQWDDWLDAQPPKLRKMLVAGENRRTTLIKDANRRVIYLRKMAKEKTASREERSAFNKEANELQAMIEQLKKSSRPVFPEIPEPLEIGSIGIVPNLVCDQVISDTEFNASIVHRSGQSERVRIQGMPTRGMTDDKEYKISGAMIVVGTTTYRTALGSTRTVLLVEPLRADTDLPAGALAAVKRLAASQEK